MPALRQTSLSEATGTTPGEIYNKKFCTRDIVLLELVWYTKLALLSHSGAKIKTLSPSADRR